MPTKDVETLKDRLAPLEMSGDAFRSAGHQLVNQIADWLETLPNGPVMRDESPADVRRALNSTASLPEAGCDAGPLLAEAAQLLFEHSLFNGHPRFYGYITSSPAPIGALGDLLAAAVNANVGAWRLAPVAT
jgi:glutamate/tyrosine decarboxylase-like PLP-dependent enzyme